VENAEDYVFTGFVEDIIELCHQEKRDHQIADQVLQLYEAMASCHAITFINNDLIGDPLEIKMF
jgi:UDP-N-acetylmuramyl pentapeptide phosphotransferase/UDP-N-acetylglucosamine-1-phosphate transferase|tara:strand:+ start:1416 stop:1607 length:192 start_codon:yes stop_codon:yes gene_type:complete